MGDNIYYETQQKNWAKLTFKKSYVLLKKKIHVLSTFLVHLKKLWEVLECISYEFTQFENHQFSMIFRSKKTLKIPSLEKCLNQFYITSTYLHRHILSVFFHEFFIISTIFDRHPSFVNSDPSLKTSDHTISKKSVWVSTLSSFRATSI